MKRSEVTDNHLRIIKDIQDKNSNVFHTVPTATWLYTFVYAAAAICNALLDIANAIRETK